MLVAISGLCGCTAGVAEGIDDERLNRAIVRIVASMPDTWKLNAERTRADVIPDGHYDGLKYEGKGGLKVALVGTEDVTYDWRDMSGVWHREPILKEAIVLWIMPPEYSQSWKRFFVMKSRVPVPLIYSGKKVHVYGLESFQGPPGGSNRFREVLPYASQFAATPEHTVSSWVTWKEDISKALQEQEVEQEVEQDTGEN
jgi:hypothetical protein